MRLTWDSATGVAGIPEVVLVPGLGLDERSSARLRRRIGGAVVILPAMGLRRRIGSLDDLAAQLIASLPSQRVVLVGHSPSCQVVGVRRTAGWWSWPARRT